MPAMFLPWILKMAANTVVMMTMSEALKRSGQPKLQNLADPAHTKIGANNMSRYDLVGADLMSLIAGDDDDFGGIGSDEGLLDALSVSGAGTSELIGSEQREGARKAIEMIKARSGVALVHNKPNRKRLMPLGFTPTTILMANVGTIPAAPQHVYRTGRLMIPSDIAFDLGVTDFKVGNQSQFVQTTEVPAALFSEVAINTGVQFDTAEVGNQLSIAVRNKDASNDVVFTAACVGLVAK